MKRVKIYLRSIEYDGKKHLAMFDSNHDGAIDTLTTRVLERGTVIWKFDHHSGIRNIIKIYSKEGKHNVFKIDPKKRLLCKEFILQLPDAAKGEEAYSIDYVLCDDTKMTIDPYIRVEPPPI